MLSLFFAFEEQLNAMKLNDVQQLKRNKTFHRKCFIY